MSSKQRYEGFILKTHTGSYILVGDRFITGRDSFYNKLVTIKEGLNFVGQKHISQIIMELYSENVIHILEKQTERL